MAIFFSYSLVSKAPLLLSLLLQITRKYPKKDSKTQNKHIARQIAVHTNIPHSSSPSDVRFRLHDSALVSDRQSASVSFPVYWTSVYISNKQDTGTSSIFPDEAYARMYNVIFDISYLYILHSLPHLILQITTYIIRFHLLFLY